MNNQDNISALKALTCELVNNTLQKIRTHREGHNLTYEPRLVTPEYLLDEALEYVSGAWDLILSDRPKAAVALSRWVVEASINLYWVVKGMPDGADDRLKDLVGEALRNEVNLFKGLSKFFPEKANALSEIAGRASEARTQNLGIETRLHGLENRIKEADMPPTLYSAYRICCGAAHPALNVWEKFQEEGLNGPGSLIETYTACWMAAQSTFHLVIGSYMLTKIETGDDEFPQKWWTDKVEPLLEQVKRTSLGTDNTSER